MDDSLAFQKERFLFIEKLGSNPSLKSQALDFLVATQPFKYSYHFDWLGLPIIQFPQDILAIQEIIWKIKPDVIIETGVARGGSLLLSASILHLINGNGKVIGVDIDIRPHNKKAIESHSLFFRISLIEGSSVDLNIIDRIKKMILPSNKVMIILDSNHTHEHVLQELRLYSSFVVKDSYIIVMDTVIEDMPGNSFPNNLWGKGNNPKTAVKEFLRENNRFEIDHDIQNKLLITVAPDGYLKCVQ